MIIDSQNEFCDATSAILASGATGAILGNVINTAASSAFNTLVDQGTGERVYLVIQVATTFVGATSTTVFSLRTDSAAALTSSPTTHWSSAAIPVATLVAGYTIVVPLPAEATYERYMGLWETVATANVTAGAVNAFLTHDITRWKAYADNAV